MADLQLARRRRGEHLARTTGLGGHRRIRGRRPYRCRAHVGGGTSRSVGGGMALGHSHRAGRRRRDRGIVGRRPGLATSVQARQDIDADREGAGRRLGRPADRRALLLFFRGRRFEGSRRYLIRPSRADGDDWIIRRASTALRS